VPLTPQEDIYVLCEDGCKPLYDGDNFARENNELNYVKCSMGKNAANAMVARKSFVGSDNYNNLMSAMGLSSPGSQTNSVPTRLTEEGDVGLFSSDTVRLHRLNNAETDAGFRSFFSAYNNFREIRNTDVSLLCGI